MALSVCNIWVRGHWIRRELSQFCKHTCKYILCLYVYLSELLLGDSPHSGMCAPERAVAWSFSTLRLYMYVYCLYVYLSELLLGDSPRSGMCAPDRAVAWSLSTLRLYMYMYVYYYTCMY